MTGEWTMPMQVIGLRFLYCSDLVVRLPLREGIFPGQGWGEMYSMVGSHTIASKYAASDVVEHKTVLCCMS